MTQIKIGILHPGAMGIAVAASMQNSGYNVCWASEGRSSESQARAAEYNLTDVKTLAALVEQCGTLISVCPPHAAEALAHSIIALGFKGTYVDANAISPQKMGRIAAALTEAGCTPIDGSIVGGPPTKRNETWLYLSGVGAADVAELFKEGLMETDVINDQIGSASAMKMCYAANTKGGLALVTMILAGADQMGVRDTLIRQWERHNTANGLRALDSAPRVAHQKAWRFAGEMDEMVETFTGLGLPGGFHEGAGDIYRRLAHLRDSAEQPTLLETLAALETKDT